MRASPLSSILPITARVLDEMEKNGGATTAEFRKELAAKAFARTGAYDAAIGSLVRRDHGRPHASAPRHSPARWPMRSAMARTRINGRAFYRTGETRFGVATATQVQGKELSYNNLNDADAAYELVAEFDPNVTAAVAIIKHANPCGVAVGRDAEARPTSRRCAAILRAPSAASSRSTAASMRMRRSEIVKIFTEVIIAPDASDEAKAIIAGKKNLRLLLAGGLPDPQRAGLTFRSLVRRVSRAGARQRRGRRRSI